MPIFEEKPKSSYQHPEDTNVSENEVTDVEPKKIPSPPTSLQQNAATGNKLHLSRKERLLKKGKSHKQANSVSSKTKRALAKFASFAGVFSMLNSAGNTCKNIPSNPFLLALGIGLVITAIGLFIWSLLS